ncbi:DUF2207 domain-containing protein, partial [Microbacterium sp. zg.Y909]|nr:DUF2207 domain-containing protein [Microbacterium sp. zg.Y909]
MVRMRVRVSVLLGLVAAAFAVSAGAAAPASMPAQVVAVGAVSADVDDFTFDSLDADYTLTRAEDGTSRLRVVETFVAEFPDIDQ